MGLTVVLLQFLERENHKHISYKDSLAVASDFSDKYAVSYHLTHPLIKLGF
jgi:hypothetical protein